MENKYNGHYVIPLFYYLLEECSDEKGSKYYFCKLLKKVATKHVIYDFLNTLEQFGALEMVNSKKGIYQINKENLKKAFMSYKESQMVDKILTRLNNIIIDFDRFW